MSELGTLRPEVREALNRISRNFYISADTDTIRAELLSVASENASLRAEVERLRARMGGAPITELHWLDTSWATHPFSHELQRLIGKRVRLLVDEPQDDNAKEGRSRE